MVNTCTLVLRTRYLAVHLDYFLNMLICCSMFLFTKKIQQFYPLVFEQRLVGNLISSTISCQTKNKYLKRQVEEIDTVLQKANPKRMLIGTNVDSDTKSTTGVRTILHFEYDSSMVFKSTKTRRNRHLHQYKGECILSTTRLILLYLQEESRTHNPASLVTSTEQANRTLRNS
jgi:hypothetical protein